MKLLEATGLKSLPVGDGEALSNVEYLFHIILKNKVTELELTHKEFVTFKLGLANILPYEAHKSMQDEFWCCGVHIKMA